MWRWCGTGEEAGDNGNKGVSLIPLGWEEVVSDT